MNFHDLINRLHARHDGLFTVAPSEQKKTIEELIKESALTQSYYFMLLFSSFIVVAGLLLNYPAIIISGMLISPLLKPLLALALGVSTMNARLMLRAFLVTLFSSLIVILLAFTLALRQYTSLSPEITDRLVLNTLTLLISFFAGMAATLGWTKQKSLSEILSGVAIAVTILPPLALVGIAYSLDDVHLFRLSLATFLAHVGLTLTGSVFVFLLSRFTPTRPLRQEVEKKLDEDNHE